MKRSTLNKFIVNNTFYSEQTFCKLATARSSPLRKKRDGCGSNEMKNYKERQWHTIDHFYSYFRVSSVYPLVSVASQRWKVNEEDQTEWLARFSPSFLENALCDHSIDPRKMDGDASFGDYVTMMILLRPRSFFSSFCVALTLQPLRRGGF